MKNFRRDFGDNADLHEYVLRREAGEPAESPAFEDGDEVFCLLNGAVAFGVIEEAGHVPVVLDDCHMVDGDWICMVRFNPGLGLGSLPYTFMAGEVYKTYDGAVEALGGPDFFAANRPFFGQRRINGRKCGRIAAMTPEYE